MILNYNIIKRSIKYLIKLRDPYLIIILSRDKYNILILLMYQDLITIVLKY